MMKQDSPPRRARTRSDPYLYNESRAPASAPARRDGQRPARRGRQGDRRAGHRHRLQPAGLARRDCGRRGSKDAWAKAATTPTRSGDAAEVYEQIVELGSPERPRFAPARWPTTPSRQALGEDEAERIEPPPSLTDAQIVEAVGKAAAMAQDRTSARSRSPSAATSASAARGAIAPGPSAAARSTRRDGHAPRHQLRTLAPTASR